MGGFFYILFKKLIFMLVFFNWNVKMSQVAIVKAADTERKVFGGAGKRRPRRKMKRFII